MTSRLSAVTGTVATSPRRGWSWVTRHPSGTGRPRSRRRQATLGPEACWSPTVVGLAVPTAWARAGDPGDGRDLVGRAAQEGERPGSGRLVLLVDDRLDVDPAGATGLDLGHAGRATRDRRGRRTRARPDGTRLMSARSSTPSASASSSTATIRRAPAAGRRTWRTRPRGSPRAWPAARRCPTGTTCAGSTPLRERPAPSIAGSSGPRA